MPQSTAREVAVQIQHSSVWKLHCNYATMLAWAALRNGLSHNSFCFCCVCPMLRGSLEGKIVGEFLMVLIFSFVSSVYRYFVSTHNERRKTHMADKLIYYYQIMGYFTRIEINLNSHICTFHTRNVTSHSMGHLCNGLESRECSSFKENVKTKTPLTIRRITNARNRTKY